MGTSDISRNGFDPRKHYTSVRMQQGRVLTDDDWNENERIDNEIERRTNVDVIGPNGSPDNGFRIKKGSVRTVDNVIDFDILPGTYYPGGLRVELDTADPGQSSAPQTFRTQKDWLQQDIDLYPVPNIGNGDEQYDLVYLEAWQQPVTAVEDSELFEAALGGPDTITKIRNMARVKLQPDTGFSDCANSWKKLIESWESNNQGKISEDHELIPDTKLKVTYTEGESDDLCSPSISGGYLGAENQAIRVQLTGNDKFTWGFDNASSLYRVEQTGSTASDDNFKLITSPKDQHHWPLAGQVVEILPWSALLINGEKTSALSGFISKVKKSYNPDTSELTIEGHIPANYGNEWKNRSNSADIAKPSEFYYLRIWSRGTDLTSSAEISFVEGTSVTLGNTGLQITITGSDRQISDYWIIAARPETPDQVVPWELEDGIPPHGIRTYFAPLAILRWTNVGGVVTGEVFHDCRRTFRPLTGLKTCCTFTVGNGKDSIGDFNSIQEAVDNLPEKGGKICVLPGEHKANAVITKRKQVWINGCPGQTIVKPLSEKYAEPVFNIHNSQDISISNFIISAEYGKAILVQDSKEDKLPSSNITIDENNILVRIYAIKVRVNNDIRGNNNIIVRNNRIGMIDDEIGLVAISSLADNVTIEGNRIVVIPPPDPEDPGDPRLADDPTKDLPEKPCPDPEAPGYKIGVILYWVFLFLKLIKTFLKVKNFKTIGGIQIENGSEYVKILDNEIIGGKGNGITLGSYINYKDNVVITGETEVIEIPDYIKDAEFKVIENDNPMEGVEVVLKSDYATETGTSLSNGEFSSSLQPGVYSAYVATPGYSMQGIEKSENYSPDGAQFVIALEKYAPEDPEIENTDDKVPEDEVPEDKAPPIYDVLIENNTISNMGLSGIGSASFQNAEGLEQALLAHSLHYQPLSPILMGTVEDIYINKNTITRCAQQLPPDISVNTGYGGIALGACENVLMTDNIIEENGISHIDPICGIYIFEGEKIEINHNRVLNNGPAVIISEGQNIKKGIRGGIIISLSMKQPELGGSKNGKWILPDGIPAVKIHDNIVTQPYGQALGIVALGPVSVIGNQLTTQGADILVNPNSAYAGCVFILNLGLSKDMLAGSFASNFYLLAYAASVFNQRKQLYELSKQLFYLPNGIIQFTGNQVTLDLRAIGFNYAFSSQIIASLDDIAFNNNQLEIESYIDLILTDTALIGNTIRSSDNRFQEGFTLAPFSLLSYGKMNAAVANQASHCIIVLGDLQYLVNDNNRVLLNPECNEYQLALEGIYSRQIYNKDESIDR